MAGSTSSRRDFLRRCAAVSTATMLATRMPSSASQDKPGIDWNAQQEDPAKMISVGIRTQRDFLWSLYGHVDITRPKVI